MKERPILFSGPMVRAILAGTKTQTRRVARPQPVRREDRGGYWEWTGKLGSAWWSGDRPPSACALMGMRNECPYGIPGDRLWVRETWRCDEEPEINYRASPNEWHRDGVSEGIDWWVRWRMKSGNGRWITSIYMPRWASRITLEITSVRVERVHDISEEDAKAEGAPIENGHETRGAWFGCGPTHREGFAQLWQDINGVESWKANPWVWVVGFRRLP